MTNYMYRRVTSAKACVPITDEQYEDLVTAIDIQLEALYLEQKFDFVIENYLEFEQTILKCGLEHMIIGRRPTSAFDADTALLNRRIMNFLTTYKTYDDSFLQHINRISNRDESVAAAAKLSFSEEFDSRTAYWLLPKIRNFVQHQGFPVHGSLYNSRWLPAEDKKDDRCRYTVELYVTAKELSKGDFSEAALARIKSMGERIDLKYIIRDFMDGYSTAHARNRALIKPMIAWAEEYIGSAEQYFCSASEETSSTALAVCTREPFEYRYLLSTKASREELERKNGALWNLALRFISNEVDKDNMPAAKPSA